MNQVKTCIIEGRTYGVGDVVPGQHFPLVDGVYRIDASGGWRWFVIHANPQCEGRAVKAIEDKGLKAFMPTLRKCAVAHRKRVVRVRPLFPRYLFVGCPVDRHGDVDMFAARRCDGVKDVVHGAGLPIAIQDEAIGDLMVYEERGWLDLTGEKDFAPQARQQMHKGTFGESMREVMRAKPHDRLAVFLRHFQAPSKPLKRAAA